MVFSTTPKYTRGFFAQFSLFNYFTPQLRAHRFLNPSDFTSRHNQILRSNNVSSPYIGPLGTIRTLIGYPNRSTQRFSSNMSGKAETRSKRRNSPVSAIERPKKQLKQENGVPTPGDATPQNGSVYSVEADTNLIPILNTSAAAGDSPEWQATIERVIKSVVSIHFCQTCSFDTDSSTSSQATGFVVDAERGYILTNRHVVCAGPFRGYCVFDNHEEVRSRKILKLHMANLCSVM